MSPTHRSSPLLLAALALGAALTGCDTPGLPHWFEDAPLRVGYFHGGRNTLLYRAMDDGGYEREGVKVVFSATKDADDSIFYDLPPTILAFRMVTRQEAGAGDFGRTTGPEIIAEMKSGRLDCGMIGESSFLLVVNEGMPWTAIAKLGQDSRDAPGKVVIVRKALDIRGPADFKGLSIGSRESGPFDAVMVREFLLHQGVALDDVTILDQVPSARLKQMLDATAVDLAFLHLQVAADHVGDGTYELFPNFKYDFADPSLSQSLLVCRNDVILARRDSLLRFLRAYKRRVDYERALTPGDRAMNGRDKSLGMDLSFFVGFNLPQYSPVPTVELPTLEAMQALLVKHAYIPGAKPIAPYVDNSILLEAVKSVEASPPAQPDATPSFRDSTPPTRLIATLDQDHDGRLCAFEFDSAAAPGMEFEKLDLNGDSYIDADELRKLLYTVEPLLADYRGRGQAGEKPPQAGKKHGTSAPVDPGPTVPLDGDHP